MIPTTSGFAAQLFQGLVRTVIPALVALVTNWFVARGIDPGPFKDLIALAIAGAVGGAYWLVVRLLEEKVAPKFGWLLGKKGSPVYPAVPGASEVGNG